MGIKYHQGDVVLIECTIPKDAKIIGKDIVQYGEITGHAHRIEGSVIYEHNRIKFVKVTKDTPMTHEEHPEKVIRKRDYKVQIHQEYFPDGSRQVID